MVEIEVVPRANGFFAAFVDGREVCVSRTPLLAAARVLRQQGTAPSAVLCMRHQGSRTIALRSTVGYAAKMGVDETDLRFRPYRAGPRHGREPAQEPED